MVSKTTESRGYRADLDLLDRPVVVDLTKQDKAEPEHCSGGQEWEGVGLVKHRTKGRWVAAAVLFVLFLVAAWVVWENFLHYEAYGVVAGEVVQVSALIDGRVGRVRVADGGRVGRGQVLVELDNLHLMQELEGLEDDLLVARGQLASSGAVLRWRRASQAEQYYEAVAEHHTLRARLMSERARLKEMQIEVETTRSLNDAKAATDHELLVQEVNIEGQINSVAQLEQAASDLDERVRVSNGLVDEGGEALAVERARIARLEGQIHRLQQKLEWCAVRSPVEGVVLNRQKLVGEHATALEPLVSVLDVASLRVVIYLRQASSDRVSIGDEIEVVTEPQGRRVQCRVERLDPQYTLAGPSIKRWYRADEPLMKVYLEVVPDQDEPAWLLKPGQVVKFPRTW